MKRILTIITVSLAVASCNPVKPVSEEKTNNEAVTVDFLFEHEGCKLYRFKDDGTRIYYSSCNRPIVSVRRESCGKACTREVQTQTIPVGR